MNYNTHRKNQDAETYIVYNYCVISIGAIQVIAFI